MHHEEIKLRKATVHDVPAIADIVNCYAQQGTMLPRPISRIYDNVRDYHVIEHNSEIIGCGALHVMWADLAEIRAVALREEYTGKGYGRLLVEVLMEEAKDIEIQKVFVLTYRPEFFEKLKFTVIQKTELPHKIWSECVNCINFPDCSEVAMLRII